jgi:hypothetical protein
MDKQKTMKNLGILGMVVAAVGTAYAVRHRKDIAKKVPEVVEEVKERSALALHHRIGYPVWEYIKRKNSLPF